MSVLKDLVGAYLITVGGAVAAFFIINSVLADSIDVLNVLMVIGLALALAFNQWHKFDVGTGEASAPVTSHYL